MHIANVSYLGFACLHSHTDMWKAFKIASLASHMRIKDDNPNPQPVLASMLARMNLHMGRSERMRCRVRAEASRVTEKGSKSKKRIE